jgi:hypothetical protein
VRNNRIVISIDRSLRKNLACLRVQNLKSPWFQSAQQRNALAIETQASYAATAVHIYEVRPRGDARTVDLISDALPFGCRW